uniref:Glycophorin-binding protein n=1 Tax=Parastrongyloides trichosuri TaxID=131310 RepID=A0A0N4Z171_PARTI
MVMKKRTISDKNNTSIKLDDVKTTTQKVTSTTKGQVYKVTSNSSSKDNKKIDIKQNQKISAHISSNSVSSSSNVKDIRHTRNVYMSREELTIIQPKRGLSNLGIFLIVVVVLGMVAIISYIFYVKRSRISKSGIKRKTLSSIDLEKNPGPNDNNPKKDTKNEAKVMDEDEKPHESDNKNNKQTK